MTRPFNDPTAPTEDMPQSALRFQPPAQMSLSANVQTEAYARAAGDPESFWAEQAQRSGAEQRRPRNIPALFPNLGNAAEHNIVDMIRRKAISINDRTQDIRPQMIGAHAGERSPKTADRGPNGINYHYSRHIASP